jgi:hypothetical protein
MVISLNLLTRLGDSACYTSYYLVKSGTLKSFTFPRCCNSFARFYISMFYLKAEHQDLASPLEVQFFWVIPMSFWLKFQLALVYSDALHLI